MFSAPPPAPYNGRLLKAWPVPSPHRIVQGLLPVLPGQAIKVFLWLQSSWGHQKSLSCLTVYSLGNGSPENSLLCHSATVGRPLHSAIEPFSPDWHFFFISMGDTSQHFFLPVLFYFYARRKNLSPGFCCFFFFKSHFCEISVAMFEVPRVNE